jgi:hypothetical protein
MRQVISLLTILGLIAGCKTPTHERVFLRSTESPATTEARFNGQYRLYAGTHRFPTVQTAKPLLEARLAKGELIGFARDASGNLLAVVRSEQKPIPDASASASFNWTMQPDPSQFDPDRTVLLIMSIVLVAGITVGIIGVATNPWN